MADRNAFRPRSYVAVGDSFTEGLEDQRPDGSYRGWADLVAAGLARRSPDSEKFGYANLAIRGKKLHQIVAEQVPAAVALEPDLVSFVGGVNDLMRPRFDIAEIRGHLASSVAALRGSGAEVILLIGANPAALASNLASFLSGRLDALNQTVAEIAEEFGCWTTDLRDTPVFNHADMWSPDRLHLSSLGHERVAGAYLEALGAGDDSWREELPPADAPPLPQRIAADGEWVGKYLVPWLGRRVTRRSSGDGREPKRPVLSPVEVGS